MDFYLLDENKQPYKVSIEEMHKLYNDLSIKVVQQDKLPNGKFVSTVFLGIDHSWGITNDPNHKPVLWETMVFNDLEDSGITEEYQERYTSYQDAVEGHKRALEYANISTE